MIIRTPAAAQLKTLYKQHFLLSHDALRDVYLWSAITVDNWAKQAKVLLWDSQSLMLAILDFPISRYFLQPPLHPHTHQHIRIGCWAPGPINSIPDSIWGGGEQLIKLPHGLPSNLTICDVEFKLTGLFAIASRKWIDRGWIEAASQSLCCLCGQNTKAAQKLKQRGFTLFVLEIYDSFPFWLLLEASVISPAPKTSMPWKIKPINSLPFLSWCTKYSNVHCCYLHLDFLLLRRTS